MQDATKVILFVEDNADDEALTLRAFAKNNIASRTVVVRDGAEALEWVFKRGRHARRSEPDPALILLDLDVPSVNGLEVLRQVREDARTRLLPVVVLTAGGERTDLLRAYELRANSFIRKPFDFARYVEVIRHLGYYWLDLNEPPPAGDSEARS
jgi:two-component system response regulator